LLLHTRNLDQRPAQAEFTHVLWLMVCEAGRGP
jgi:hypothetical protein